MSQVFEPEPIGEQHGFFKHYVKIAGRKARCALCHGKILIDAPYSINNGLICHDACIEETKNLDNNVRRHTLKLMGIGAAFAGATAIGASRLASASGVQQTQITANGVILPSLTSDPANPEPGQMWYRSDAGVTAHFDAIENRVIYSNRIVDGSEVVSAKGIVNGLSVLPNDGQDWGPDTMLGATAPGQYGPTYTTTSGFSEAVNYATSNKQNLSMMAGAFHFTTTPIISAGITIRGSGMYYYDTYSPQPPSLPTIFPNTTVIYQDTPDIDALQITVNYEAVNLYDFGIIFTSTSSSGHGINCTPANTGELGMTHATWDNIIVFKTGNELSHYAYNFVNMSDCVFGQLWAFNMPYMNIDNQTAYSYGNSVFTKLSFQGCPSSATVNAFQINSSNTSGSVNLITITYMELTDGPTSSGLYCLYIGQYTEEISIDFWDSESGSSAYFAGQAITILTLVAVATPTFTIDNGVLTIIASTAGAINIVNNSGVAFLHEVWVNSYSESGNAYTRITSALRRVGIAATISTNPPLASTPYQNVNPFDIYISVPITFPTTSDTAASAYLRVGASGTTGANPIVDQFAEPATLATVNGRTWSLNAKVQPGQYFEVDVTNATIGTAVVTAST